MAKEELLEFPGTVSELLLNASFDDIMASASRLLGRNMAMYIDAQARTTLQRGASVAYGYSPPTDLTTGYGVYNGGTAGTSATITDTSSFYLTPYTIKDAVEALASKNVPRLGETYVCFVHPHQSRWLREDPTWIESSKYAQPGAFSLGEIGRIDDVIFIETTQVKKIDNGNATTHADVYQSICIGDNAFGHAISLPVELRDGGVQDFGREHLLSWYSIFGLGLITDASVVIAETN